jgi:TatD DNase family protein
MLRRAQIHVHCFTDSPDFAQRLLDYFSNLYIGITGTRPPPSLRTPLTPRAGVITYTTNPNTAAVVRALASSPVPSSTAPHNGLRILLETDAPYMIPSTLYADLPAPGKLPLSHAGMIPWTAACVAEVAEAARTAKGGGGGEEWSVLRVLGVARENARAMYGV